MTGHREDAEIQRKLWREHAAAAFPREMYRLSEPDFVLLDADIAGCACSLATRDRLADPSHGELLTRCLDELASKMHLLETEEARTYCRRLLELGRVTLRLAGRSRPVPPDGEPGEELKGKADNDK